MKADAVLRRAQALLANEAQRILTKQTPCAEGMREEIAKVLDNACCIIQIVRNALPPVKDQKPQPPGKSSMPGWPNWSGRT